ncbi:MAG TPA: hypothetical protein PKY81_08760 [bacterium]|nr:hypothetical protein [bacterium]HPN31035.1 hypothetical protein [bacterium]
MPALKYEYDNYGGNTKIFTDNQDVSVEKKYYESSGRLFEISEKENFKI